MMYIRIKPKQTLKHTHATMIPKKINVCNALLKINTEI